jgi:hypothetical protein
VSQGIGLKRWAFSRVNLEVLAQGVSDRRPLERHLRRTNW